MPDAPNRSRVPSREELERHLEHNIRRAEKAEAELREIKRRLGDFSRLLRDHRGYFGA